LVLVLVLGAVGWQSVASLLAYHSRKISRAAADPTWTTGNVHTKLTSLASAAAKPLRIAPPPDVYPYSVVPGGIYSANDLQRAVEHDRVVWEHYAQFRFEHARLVRATEAREVYLSYRLRDHIYWTRKRMRLHVGEMLITDGKITARTRCGNQVSEQPKPDVSEEEPAEDILDRPVAQAYPTPALPMQSSLRPTPSLGPTAPQEPPLQGFAFPLIPFGVPNPPRLCKAPGQGGADSAIDDKHCRPHHHKPPVVPEPSAILLIASGLAAVYWQYRRRSLARAQ
jgi:hypothetical protein